MARRERGKKSRPGARRTGRKRARIGRVLTPADLSEGGKARKAQLQAEIRDLVARWPEEWLDRLNHVDLPPGPMGQLIGDALEDLARTGKSSRDLQLETLSRYLRNLDMLARSLGSAVAVAVALGEGRDWLKAFVDLDPAPLPRLKECRRCREWFWDKTDARLQKYCPYARCRKDASEAGQRDTDPIRPRWRDILGDLDTPPAT